MKMIDINIVNQSSQHVDANFPWESIERATTDYGTPLFIYFPELAKEAFLRMAGAAEAWGKARIAYSVKTNPLPELLSDLRQLNAWVETVSSGEQQIVQGVGYTPDEIIFNGPLKKTEDLREAAASGICSINIDSLEELEKIRPLASKVSRQINIGIRLCPPRNGISWSRFGLMPGEAEIALKQILGSPGFRLTCVHFHLGTQNHDFQRFITMLSIVENLWKQFDLTDEVWLDIGGGFPFQHDRAVSDQVFDVKALIRTITQSWSLNTRPGLILEPGRIIAAPAFALIGQVLAVKARPSEPNIIVLDAGTNQNAMASSCDHMWKYREPISSIGPYRFCGPLCMEHDTMSGVLSGVGPAPGSLVAMQNTGAYSLTYSRNFIQPRPAVVELPRGGEIRLIRPRGRLE